MPCFRIFVNAVCFFFTPRLCIAFLSRRVLTVELFHFKSLPHNSDKLLQAENAPSGRECSLLKDKSLKIEGHNAISKLMT